MRDSLPNSTTAGLNVLCERLSAKPIKPMCYVASIDIFMTSPLQMSVFCLFHRVIIISPKIMGETTQPLLPYLFQLLREKREEERERDKKLIGFKMIFAEVSCL